MCWCSQPHLKGGVQNGEVKHWVSNWKLYELRRKDDGPKATGHRGVQVARSQKGGNP